MSAFEILNISGWVLIFLFMVQLVAVIRVYKGFVLQSIRVMTSISLRSGKALLLFFGAVVLFCVVFQDLLYSWIPPLPPVLMTGLAMVGIGGACLPPGIIYLGASQSHAFPFVSELMLAVTPLKVAHLLSSFEAGAFLGNQVRLSEYRVTKGWQEAVSKLCDIAPLIIFDSRRITPAVLQEAEYILNSHQRQRTVFITKENGTLPVLNGVHDGFIRTLTPRAAIASLNGLGWKTLARGREAFEEVIGDGLLLR